MAIITDGVKTKFTDDTGLPLIGGQVFSYVEGTSTPKDTYQDRAFTIPNTNPIILDDVGSCQMYLKGGYRLRVLTADGVLVEEKDNAFQSDGQVLDVVANTNAIAALQTNVDVLNTRGGLKTDEHNFIIAHGRAESATVYDPVFRADKLKLALQGQEDSARNIFKTYATDTTLDGNEIKAGTYLDPELQAVKLGTAATKNIGAGAEQIPTNTQTDSKYMPKNFYGIGTSSASSYGSYATADVNDYVNNMHSIGHLRTIDLVNTGSYGYPKGIHCNLGGDVSFTFFYSDKNVSGADKALRLSLKSRTTYRTGFVLASGINAFADSNGVWKTSSPVVRIYENDIDPNDDAQKQGVTFTRNGVGDYTLHNTLGLAQTGWTITLPEDDNRNPLVAIETDYVDGDLNIRTYKRIFSMQTFTFGCDYDSPIDIPDGRCVDVRLHELPTETEQPTT